MHKTPKVSSENLNISKRAIDLILIVVDLYICFFCLSAAKPTSQTHLTERSVLFDPLGRAAYVFGFRNFCIDKVFGFDPFQI